MSVGTSIPLPAYTLDSAFVARKAEELGFESIWYAEHPIMPVKSASPFPSTGGDTPETYTHFTDEATVSGSVGGGLLVAKTVDVGRLSRDGVHLTDTILKKDIVAD